MFQYDYEKRPPSQESNATVRDCRATVRDSRVTVRDWHSRPLPPRPEDRLPTNTSVPLKVWIVATASCFAVCGALVLATIVITRSAATDSYTSREYAEPRNMKANEHTGYYVINAAHDLNRGLSTFKEPLYPIAYPQPRTTTETEPSTSQETNDIQYPILEKLPMFKNLVGNRDKKKPDKNLISKPQIHPIHDTTLHHPEKKIEKKDQAKLPDPLNLKPDKTPTKLSRYPGVREPLGNDIAKVLEFKPTLPDVFVADNGVKLTDGYVAGLRKIDDNYEEYYNDENLYDDYMQSNTMTSYLIEKVQELHDWISSDPDFDSKGAEKSNSNEFGQLLKALNESLIEGNVTIIMSKLKDIYFGENFTSVNQSRKVILSNSTNLLSFGILTLDVMLLHNIQLMAWESQETARNKMLKDPDVFAFNALFMEPAKVETKWNEIYHQYDGFAKRQNLRQETEEMDIGKNILENVLEIGMSTARAAIHLGKAFKNTKIVLSQLSNRETLNANIQNQISRNIDANTHALNHLQTSFNKNDSFSVANNTDEIYTDLDCIWLLYCKNLVATAKLNAPYGTMARINGLALRMLTGELAADRALDIMLYEALTGWTELKCNDMFPRCSKANPATVVLDSILQPVRKSQATSNRL